MWLMDQDRKSTPLKSIQGKIWAAGYASSELLAPVYDDVPPALVRWAARDRTVAIYSSGSVKAQKLLFAHTRQGDLTPSIHHWFDTTIGPKQEAASYREIASSLRLPASTILFVSDVVAELNAARSAGMSTALCVRPGNAEAGPHDHPEISSLDDLEENP